MKKWRILLSVAMVLSLGVACFGFLKNDPGYAVSYPAAYVRTDALNAENAGGTAKVAAQTGANVVFDGNATSGANNVVELGADANLTLEFKMPEGSTGGTVKFFGKNLTAAGVKFGIYDGGSANDGYLELKAAAGSTGSVLKLGFSNDTWFDADAKTIRIKIWGTSDEAKTTVHGALALDGREDKIIVSHLSFDPGSENQLRYALYLSDDVQLYYDQARDPMLHMNGNAIFEMRIPETAGQFTANFQTTNNGGNVAKLSIRNAEEGNIDGDVSKYENLVSGTAVDVSDYAVKTENGVSYKVVQINGYNNAFLKSMSIDVAERVYPETGVVAVKTDSLTAASEDGRGHIVSGNATVVLDIQNGGAETGDYNNVLSFGADASAVLSFDLPATTEGGSIRLFGKNLAKAKVGIYISDYAENDGFYVLTGEKVGDSDYGVMTYGFANNSWFDPAEKVIRVKIWGAADADGVTLNSASAVSGENTPMLSKDETIRFAPLTLNENVYSMYISNGMEVYFAGGVNPTTHLKGIVIYEVRVSAVCNELGFESDGINAYHVGVKNGEKGTADGNPANYQEVTLGGTVSLKGYTAIDPDNTANSGDEYYVVQVLAWGGENSFLKYTEMTARFNEGAQTFDALENANAAVPANEAYSYLYVGTAAERAHMFGDKAQGANFETTFEGTHSGLFVDKSGDGTNLKVNNARKLGAGEYVIYEFDLPDGTKTAQLKLFASKGARVLAHNADSTHRYPLTPVSVPGSSGVVFYEIDASNGLSSPDGKIRIEIQADKSAVSVFSLLVQADAGDYTVSESMQFNLLDEAALKYAVGATDPNRYHLNGEVPAWHLASGASVTYRFDAPAGRNEMLLALTGTGMLSAEISTDGTTFERKLLMNNNAGGVDETRYLKIDTSVNKTVYVKTAGGLGFLRYINVSYPAASSVNFELGTFTSAEYDHVVSMSMDGAANDTNAITRGLVGVSARQVSPAGRRIGFGAAASSGNAANIVYRFDFDASKIFEKDGKNSLYLNMRGVYGNYSIAVSSDPAFAENVLTTKGSAPKSIVFDASQVLTGAAETAGVKTIYVRVSHNNEEADPYLGGDLDFVFETMNLYADGGKGAEWPNDDDFDYDTPPSYDENPGLPAVPETPAPVPGTDNVAGEGGGCGGCGGGKDAAAAVLFVALLLPFGFRKGGR